MEITRAEGEFTLASSKGSLFEYAPGEAIQPEHLPRPAAGPGGALDRTDTSA
jgi:hypothetical protein